jgi:hypothetical protein
MTFTRPNPLFAAQSYKRSDAIGSGFGMHRHGASAAAKPLKTGQKRSTIAHGLLVMYKTKKELRKQRREQKFDEKTWEWD